MCQNDDAIPRKSPVTTHVLDTSLGLPARGVEIEMFKMKEMRGQVMYWDRLRSATTDNDGRVSYLLDTQVSTLQLLINGGS